MTADVPRLRLLLVSLAGWINRYQQHVIEYLVEESRALREQLTGHRLRLKDDQRRRLASARPPAVESGCHARDTGYDPAVASSADCGEVELRAEAPRASEDDEEEREAHWADGDGEPDVGL